MMFPKPMRIESWVAFDGALAVEVVDALAEQHDPAENDSAEDSGNDSDASEAQSGGMFAPMAAAATEVPSGTNEITGTIPSLQTDSDPTNDDDSYTLKLPYGVSIPEDADDDDGFRPFKDAELTLDNGLAGDAQSLYFEVKDPANGRFDFYDFDEVSGERLHGFAEGDFLFAKSQGGSTLALFRCGADGKFQQATAWNWTAIHQNAPGGGVRFALTTSFDWGGQVPDATTLAGLMFKSIVFTPEAGAEAGDSVGSFDVGVYYQKTGQGENNFPNQSSNWVDAINNNENFVGGIVDGSVAMPLVPLVPADPVDPPADPGDDTGGDEGGGSEEGGDETSGGEQGSGDPGDTPDPTPEPQPDPTPDPDPEPEPTPVDVVPEVPAPVTPPPSAGGSDSGSSAGDSGSAADAPAAEAGGDAPGSESSADAGAESGTESGDAGGADDLVYIQQREADAADAAAVAAASTQARREDAAAEDAAVTVEALPVEAAMMFELARDLENLLGSARSDRAGLEEILLRLRDEYLARPADDWGEGRSVLRRLFDFGNAEMTAINRVIAELTRQMDDFDSLPAARRDGMVMESLRELALSVERRSGETGAITQALAEVVEALSAARAGGREVDSAAVAALYERVYAQGIAVWAAKAERADPMGRELAAAEREFVRN